jgi:hypothetical protein
MSETDLALWSAGGGAEFEIDQFAGFDIGDLPKEFGVRLDVPRFRSLVGRLIAHLDASVPENEGEGQLE